MGIYICDIKFELATEACTRYETTGLARFKAGT
jgi:hypothetical protein